MTDIAKTIAKLSARPKGAAKKHAKSEKEFVAGYKQAKARPVRGLSRVRSYAIAVPRARGMDLVLAGDAEKGWPELERWWLLETLASHLIGPHIATGAHALLGYALALGEEQPAAWMATSLQAQIDKEPDFFDDVHLHHFFLQLWRLSTRRKKSDLKPGLQLGPYAPILSSWGKPAALKKALADACTRRIEAIDEHGEDMTEFWFTPLLPIEVAAVARVREARGEVVPTVEHPLLETPLAAIPRTRTYDPTDDPWYARAIESGVAAERVDPDFEWPAPAP